MSQILQAVATGFVVVMPVGPMAALCMQNTLQLGYASGVAVGFGIALADTTFGLMVALGLNVLSSWLIGHVAYIQILGGIILIYLGWQTRPRRATLRTESTTQLQPKVSFYKTAAAAYMLTLTNPMTILVFIGLLASQALSPHNLLDGAVLIGGFGFGAMLWYCVLVLLTTIMKHALSRTGRRWLAWVTSYLLIGYGVKTIAVLL